MYVPRYHRKGAVEASVWRRVGSGRAANAAISLASRLAGFPPGSPRWVWHRPRLSWPGHVFAPAPAPSAARRYPPTTTCEACGSRPTQIAVPGEVARRGPAGARPRFLLDGPLAPPLDSETARLVGDLEDLLGADVDEPLGVDRDRAVLFHCPPRGTRRGAGCRSARSRLPSPGRCGGRRSRGLCTTSGRGDTGRGRCRSGRTPCLPIPCERPPGAGGGSREPTARRGARRAGSSSEGTRGGRVHPDRPPRTSRRGVAPRS